MFRNEALAGSASVPLLCSRCQGHGRAGPSVSKVSARGNDPHEASYFFRRDYFAPVLSADGLGSSFGVAGMTMIWP